MSIVGSLINSPSGLNKPQNFGKSKKNRKSPIPMDYENASSNRAEGNVSPAYSDISDDSTPIPITENDIGGKIK